ncbi:class I poly(R)-hydroxyalkanoic acid synthase [bacterium]|nr:class I poly(R)-hydroxyalkanoic acid synthase [bacterium]
MTDTPDNGPAEDVARIQARILELSRDIEALTREATRPRRIADFASAQRAIEAVWSAYAADPQRLAEAQADLFRRHMQEFTRQPDDAADARPDHATDGAPAAPFEFLRRMHQATSDWLTSLAMDAPGVAAIDRRRAAFVVRQAAAALSPSNLLSGNREALEAFIATGGDSLSRGLSNLKDDLTAGRFAPPQSEPGAFRLGVDLAATPGEVAFANELIELIRYLPSREAVYERPLLIFPPWINKFYVLDLRPENSLAAWLRDQGFTVYIVSWRSADREIADFGWEDYMRLGGRTALDWVAWAHGAPVNAAGYCVGGVLLASLAAQLAEENDPRLASLSLLATQTDFSEPGDLGLFVDDEAIATMTALIDQAGGVMPGEAMREAFDLLRPDSLIWRFAAERYLMGRTPPPFDLLHWNGDQTNLPGRLHLESLRAFYVDNALARGMFQIDGRAIDLGAIAAPLFLQAALRDHISPPASVYKAGRLVGGEVEFVLCDSGHIAGVVNPPSAGKYRHWTREGLPETLGGWLEGATQVEGSWWPRWARWLGARSGALAPPPNAIPDAPPAPGAYVHETLDTIRARGG